MSEKRNGLKKAFPVMTPASNFTVPGSKVRRPDRCPAAGLQAL
jgi:hypothetical protein